MKDGKNTKKAEDILETLDQVVEIGKVLKPGKITTKVDEAVEVSKQGVGLFKTIWGLIKKKK